MINNYFNNNLGLGSEIFYMVITCTKFKLKKILNLKNKILKIRREM